MGVENMTGGESGRVDIEYAAHIGCAAFGMNDRGAFVEAGDLAGQISHQRGRECANGGHPVEEAFLVETFHLNDGIDRHARAVERHPAAPVPVDPPHAQIKIRRRLAVQRDFLLAGGETEGAGRKIRIGQLDRPLQLIGSLPHKKDLRDMRLHPLDGPALPIS